MTVRRVGPYFGKRVLCRVRRHRWIRGVTEDGQPYLRCARCRTTWSGRPTSPP
jgi:hypothetical protein